MSLVSIGLVHFPVLDRQGAIITTAITNLDLHDMARSSCTYGIRNLFIVHPVAAQRELALRVKTHWTSGSGAVRIPTREPAMALLEIVPTIDDVYTALGGRSQVDVYVTSAKSDHRTTLGYGDARRRMDETAKSSLVLFGTGWGLAPELMNGADALLPPILGTNPAGYNHLSVRAACAIVLDRLFGARS
jgi:hypothetical protein